MSQPESRPPDPITFSLAATMPPITARARLVTWRLMSPEALVFGIVLCGIGFVVWKFKHVRGIGDGILTAGIVIVLANVLRVLHGWLVMKDKPWSRWIVRSTGLGP